MQEADIREAAMGQFPVDFPQPAEFLVHSEEIAFRVRRGAAREEPSLAATDVNFERRP